MTSTQPVYLDNNATTAMCKPAIAAMTKWLELPANPSSSGSFGTAAREMIETSRKFIASHCHAQNYVVVFTSGASESNCFIIRATVEAYKRQRGVTPHVLTSLTEHKSVIKCCEALKAAGLAEITYLAPGASGCIPVKLIEHGIRDNTCIVSIMAANNELGCINNLKEIGAIAHSRSVPFHSDFVQVFGKFRINLPEHNIDAISASFHKLYGPKGSGILVINKDLVTGYGLEGQISGTQEFGLRGGTENVAAIAGSIAALKHAFTNRAAKNAKLFAQREYILSKLRSKFLVRTYKSFLGDNQDVQSQEAKSSAAAKKASVEKPISLVFLGPECKTTKSDAAVTSLPRVLPNTILIAAVKADGSVPFCNVKLKAALNKNNIIVSIGSACNTASPDASHVLDAIHAPDAIKRGVIRISFGDTTTKKELDTFIVAFVSAVNAQA
jgi:cysteine desulfurase